MSTAVWDRSPAPRENTKTTGAFHTAAKFTPVWKLSVAAAAVWNAPVVFVFSRGAGLRSQTAVDTIAEKAEAYGVPALELDGSDLNAVLDGVGEALERVRAGEGPLLIDAACPDPPAEGPEATGPRSPEDEEAAWQAADPLEKALSLVSDAGELRARAEAAVAAGAAEALALPAPPTATLFEDVFARRTPALDAQRTDWLERS